MLLQAILLGLVAMLGNAEYLFGTSLLSRPLVMGALTGVVLGDIPTGVTLGAIKHFDPCFKYQRQLVSINII